MLRYLQGSIVIFLLTLLTGCNENKSDIWYMQHPEALRRELNKCQSATNTNKQQCDRLMSVAENLQAILMDQQTHPEEFGQRIMAAEENAVKLRAAVQEAQMKLNKLKQENAAPEELRVGQDNLYKAQKAFHDLNQQIKIMLAVVGLSRPE